MLFDDEDSLELDNQSFHNFRKPPKCVPLPLKTYISLKDLWVPSELLPSRNNVLHNSRNQSYIFHTLEKTDVESLSVYFEDFENNLDNKVLTNPLACTGISNQNDISSGFDERDQPNLYYSDNSDEHVNTSENELDIDTQITNFFEANSKAQHCQGVKLCEVPFPKCVNNALAEPSIAYQKSENNNAGQFGYFLDLINNEESFCSDTFDNSSSEAVAEILITSQQSEKEECDNSVHSVNLLQTENTEKLFCDASLVNCPNDTVPDIVFHKPGSPISRKSNIEQFENLATVNTEQPLCNDVAHCLSKVVTNLPIAFEKPLKECDNAKQLLATVSTEELSLAFVPEKCESEPVMELPIAYKRPTLDEPMKKRRNSKEKKKKTALKKNLQLGDFLQTVNSDGYDDLPKKDEFYENLVRRGICSPKVVSNEVDYPSFKSEGIEFFGASKNSNHEELCFALHPKSSSGNLFEPSVLKGTEQKKSESDPVALNFVDNELTTTLVLENICNGITKENIESLVSGYGEVKRLSLETCGKFIKAHIKLILDCDVDWLIECLNETELFGASGGVVKCYKL